MKKIRIDEYIFEHFNVGSIDDIKKLIMAGKVLNNNEPVYKASDKIAPDKAHVRFKNVKQFVSRGGLKLKHAIDSFGLDVKDRVMLDIGSSTGGFTDCALQHGAKYVYAVDVGTNQLAYQLRIDERVCVMEQTNFKDTVIENFDPLPEVISIDVSFTSIVPILRHIKSLFKDEIEIAALIKPQFESYLEEREDSGIITNPDTHYQVIQRVLKECGLLGLNPAAVDRSPITGTKGNIEYLFYLTGSETEYALTDKDIKTVVYG
ncbi:TlyA family rRNA (cytidine-2'-O)-methyltransferase [Jeotgalicoccus coquinae]|uniref:23S rRNA (Cytidine1920-2'-O)/16S rRNA (Cytidine1409-2'-O)-methyltransferase n=1 Tax=Jeotgalicoccus coquinae TaxID=709509 RepID=A0A6V7R8D5_9STAP|nr:TlyA family RNA methyltransferase [Jeotgalicoccus coquinae]MBB6422899.1 23S rRNA (cytidine1920-2'-O)/16S rRNA (cytidine1409-2'-O)-methyltransferase [Jeotgalicoccus coquinae]GGE12265.1 TlyA family rRNA (cytidine-2'-O)-methyltransferase [Jeotgalicoccus coquinae]CAD2073709.1 Hemolysin A [Jeotgalicoccus coquinae]